MFCVHKRNVSLRHFFDAHKTCLIEKTENNHFGGLNLPIIQLLKIIRNKPLVLRTLNLPDFSVMNFLFFIIGVRGQ